MLPLNPQGFGRLAPHLAFNTAISFVTNTNWQSYGGETTLSLLLADGRADGAQLPLGRHRHRARRWRVARAFARASATTLGNFWVDLTRITLYVLLPLVDRRRARLRRARRAADLSAVRSTRRRSKAPSRPSRSGPSPARRRSSSSAPMAAASSTPIPRIRSRTRTPVTNLIEILAMLSLSVRRSPITFGRMVGDARAGLGAARGDGAVRWSPARRRLLGRGRRQSAAARALGVDPACGNMEGKEVRFGTRLSALFAAITTGASCGAVNAMHDSFTPLGGLVPLFLIQLGEILPGGVGSGLYGMLVFALHRGLRRRADGRAARRNTSARRSRRSEMKLAMLAVLILPLSILGFTAVAAVLPGGARRPRQRRAARAVGDPLRLLLGDGNNGSAFAGLTANTPWYNTTLGIAMLLGRFAYRRAGDGHRRLARGQAEAAAVAPARFPTHGAAVRRPAGRRDPDPGRPAVLPRPRPRPDRRALPDARRQDLLMDRTDDPTMPAITCHARRSTARILRRAAPRRLRASSTRARWSATR